MNKKLLALILTVFIAFSVFIIKFNLMMGRSKNVSYSDFLKEVIKISDFKFENFKLFIPKGSSSSYPQIYSSIVPNLINVNELRKNSDILPVNSGLITEDVIDKESKNIIKKLGIEKIKVSYHYPDGDKVYEGYPTYFKTIFYNIDNFEFVEVIAQYNPNFNWSENLTRIEETLPISTLNEKFKEIGIDLDKQAKIQSKNCTMSLFSFSKNGILINVVYFCEEDKSNFKFINSFTRFIYN